MADSSFNGETSVIGIDIGGGTTKLALISRQGEVWGWQSFPTLGASGVDFLETVVGACRGLQAHANSPVAGVSVAVAGFVSSEGDLDYNPNLPWLEGAPIGKTLSDELRLPVHVEADSNAACLAEYLSGEGRGSSRFLCLTGGTGLGVGMIVEGKLLRIAHGCMGDAGHVIVSPEGPACTCGGRGCAEALLSTAALGMRYADARGARMQGFDHWLKMRATEYPQPAHCLKRQDTGSASPRLRWPASSCPIALPSPADFRKRATPSLCAAQASFRAHGGRLPLSLTSLVRASTGGHATLLGAAAGFFNPRLL